MITFLEGILEQAFPTHLILQVQGVGYEVLIPLSTFEALPVAGQRVRILTHLVIREDTHLLYGFLTSAERDLFRLLTQRVSGVGPKLAVAVLSSMNLNQFKAIVVAEDSQRLASVRGIGKKTAERIILELKDKVGVGTEWKAAAAAQTPSVADVAMQDAILALICLGYKQIEAHQAVKKILEISTFDPISSEELVRKALKVLL